MHILERHTFPCFCYCKMVVLSPFKLGIFVKKCIVVLILLRLIALVLRYLGNSYLTDLTVHKWNMYSIAGYLGSKRPYHRSIHKLTRFRVTLMYIVMKSLHFCFLCSRILYLKENIRWTIGSLVKTSFISCTPVSTIFLDNMGQVLVITSTCKTSTFH